MRHMWNNNNDNDENSKKLYNTDYMLVIIMKAFHSYSSLRTALWNGHLQLADGELKNEEVKELA